MNDKKPDSAADDRTTELPAEAHPEVQPASPPSASDEAVPTASIHAERNLLVVLWRQRPSRVWILTGLSLLLAIGLFWSGLRSSTTTLTVCFKQGHGIKPGDRLRHRGIDVGEVTAVTLDPELSQVNVVIELSAAADALARQGSRFWIERPRISLARVSGLETVVGAKHLGVLPGPAGRPRQTTFQGDENPPTLRDSETLTILVRFVEGHGLAIGDVVKFRGIVVGEVVQIALTEDLNGIDVHVRLAASGQPLARSGTRFWIERPRVQLTGVSGLDTLTSGQHLAAVAGPAGAAEQRVFDGLEEPPAMMERQAGGLEIVLTSRDRQGVTRGAPLTYRGLDVGHIVSVGLSADASQIEMRAYVEPAYRNLIRKNSVFWSVGGFDASFGFSGLEISSESLATIAAGGVALGTPDPPGALATVGAEFELEDEPADWRRWTPRIPVGASTLPRGAMLPQPERLALFWQQRFLGLTQDNQARGWGLLLADQRLIAPADLLLPPSAAVAGVAELQFGGKKVAVRGELVDVVDGLAVRRTDESHGGGWPLDRIRDMQAPEDCLVVFGGIGDTRSLPASRLRIEDGELTIDPAFTLPADAHGASVVAARDGKLVALIGREAGRSRLLKVASIRKP